MGNDLPKAIEIAKEHIRIGYAMELNNGVPEALETLVNEVESKNNYLLIKLLDPKCMPYKKYPTDAGLDLRCSEDVLLLPGKTKVIPSGICVAIPEGYVGDISPRSSISMRGIAIQGKIDPSYRGTVGIIATNCSNVAQFFRKHERIAQLILMKIDYPCIKMVNELDSTDRGDKGYGSTVNK